MVPSGGLDEHSAEAKRPPSTFSSIGTTEIAVFLSLAKKATSIIFSSHPAVFFPLYPDTRKREILANALTKGEFLCVENISLGAFCSGDDGRRSGEERKGRSALRQHCPGLAPTSAQSAAEDMRQKFCRIGKIAVFERPCRVWNRRLLFSVFVGSHGGAGAG